jgi:hypothetical protein
MSCRQAPREPVRKAQLSSATEAISEPATALMKRAVPFSRWSCSRTTRAHRRPCRHRGVNRIAGRKCLPECLVQQPFVVVQRFRTRRTVRVRSVDAGRYGGKAVNFLESTLGHVACSHGVCPFHPNIHHAVICYARALGNLHFMRHQR